MFDGAVRLFVGERLGLARAVATRGGSMFDSVFFFDSTAVLFDC